MKTNTKRSGRKALGRGLSSLISNPVVSLTEYQEEQPQVESIQEPQPADDRGSIFVSIQTIEPNPSQPRKSFDDQDIAELASSIKDKGVLQPLIVRPVSPGSRDKFQIVAGERRWRACQSAGIEQVPVIIKELSDWESLEIALIENVQRENLNPIDEAEAYQQLMDQYSLTQSDVAGRVGKDRATIANYIRLLKLHPEARDLVRTGELAVGHAKAVLSVKESAAQLRIAKRAVEEGLSVRALEALASQAAVLDGSKKAALKGKRGISGQTPARSVFPELDDKLRKTLGTKVSIRHQKKTGRGKIEIEYFSEEELDRLVDVLLNH